MSAARRVPPRAPGGALAVVWAVCAFAVSVPASLIAVYTREGGAFQLEEMKAFALKVKENPAEARSEVFTFKVSGKSVLSAEFSVPPGVSAFFLSDETFVRDGYRMGGESAHYEAIIPSSEEALAKEALPEAPPEKVFVTAFRGASLSPGGLRLSYSVSKPGRVKIEAMGFNGQRFGRWNVTEAAAGEYQRVFNLSQAAKGPFYVRWSHGNVQAVQKVNPPARE